MTREEAIRTAYENDAHPYSVTASVEMLLKGAEIGRKEMIEKACKVIDDLMMAYISGKLGHDEVMDKCRKALEE